MKNEQGYPGPRESPEPRALFLYTVTARAVARKTSRMTTFVNFEQKSDSRLPCFRSPFLPDSRLPRLPRLPGDLSRLSQVYPGWYRVVHSRVVYPGHGRRVY